MKSIIRCFLLTAVLAVLASAVSTSTVHADSAVEKSFEKMKSNVQRIVLSNGMRVLVFPRSRAPIFAGQLWVKVGGVDEVTGITGVSHMLEHMAFKGTEVIGTKDFGEEKPLLEKLDTLLVSAKQNPKDEQVLTEIKLVREKLESLWLSNEFTNLYSERGAVGINAATGKDYTYYMVQLPTNAFEFWCWMESERLLRPVFRQFYEEREVVREERRTRTDDSPEGRLYEALMASVYTAHPYRYPTIGWASDIENLKIQDLTDLYRRYYVPENMVAVLVGDLDAETIRPTLEKYFGRLPKATQPLPQVTTVEPPQNGPREVVVKFSSSPSFFLAYHKPTYPNKDDAYFAILHTVLADGRSSVLYRELVEQKKLAVDISTGEAPGERFNPVFYIYAVPNAGVSNETLKNEIDKILVRLKTEKFSEQDIASAKRRISVGFLKGLSSNNGLARSLASAELLHGNWSTAFDVYQTMLETNDTDLQRLLQKYFHPDNSTFVHLETGK